MKIRRFFAKDMRSALNKVTAELGADAAILSSNKVNGGVEVVAATDYDEAMLHAQKPSTKINNKENTPTGETQSSNVVSYSANAPIPETRFEDAAESRIAQSLQDILKRSLGQGKAHKRNSSNRADEPDFVEEPVAEQEPYNTEPAEFKFPNVEWSQEPTLVAMREELNLLRNLLQEQVSEIAWNKRQQASPIGAALTRTLSQQGLSRSMVEKLVLQSESEADYECAWQKALALLAKSINPGDNEILEKGGVVALVGPTGVGKTTTLAKLAAKHVMQYGKDSVALISTDGYRIAAYDQIRTFGRILQVPVRIANDEKSLKEALYQYKDKRLILIDTAGMSQQDERLAQQLSCLSSESLPISRYLVLSATSQSQVLHSAIKLFKPFHLDGCIVTKLDEAASLGEIISTIIDSNLRVLYTTDGQRVPEDIRIARAHHLVSKMVWLSRQNGQNQPMTKATGTH